MRMRGSYGWLAVLLAVLVSGTSLTAQAKPAGGRGAGGTSDSSVISRDPYLGAIVVDAATGRVLFEDNADRSGYPASVVKLMNLLVVLDTVQQGTLKLSDPVTATAEAARTGGSQVYLKEHEVFPVEDLLYALMVQSANDAATALAIHIAGSKEAFIERMNKRAQELGMTGTRFHSVHGLPPGPGQSFDQTTARDLSIVSRALLKYPDALRLTSTRERGFRNGAFILRTHNHLLARLEGCDGLKTGYIRAGGYSIAVTAQRAGRRVVAVVLGSTDRKLRDRKAEELVNQAFSSMAPALPAVAAAALTGAGAGGPPAVQPVGAAVPLGQALPLVPGLPTVPGVPGLSGPAGAPAPTPGSGAAVPGAVASAGNGQAAGSGQAGGSAAPVPGGGPGLEGLGDGREWAWGIGGLAIGLILGFVFFGRSHRRRLA